MKSILGIIMLFMLSSVAYAGISVSHTCPNNICLDGENVEFNMTIENNLNFSIVVTDYFLYETQLEKRFGQVSSPVLIAPGEIYSLTFEVPMFKPDEGFTYFYKGCVNVSQLDSITQREVCTDIKKSLTMTLKEDLECESDAECLDYEFCNTRIYRCLNVSCEGEVINHTCNTVDHPATASEDVPSAYTGYAFVILILVILAIIYFGLQRQKKAIIYMGGKKRYK
ncbi:hypothetical protein H6504_01120 [Candidatus Woesearchaeota archaeon]|nr:hypothetical protein [Candidatus Woesearchaeota archaeon]